MGKLTIKQKRFADEYIISGNATDAARKAGYKQPRSTGNENLTKPDISAYIKSKAKAIETPKIASMQEIHEFWSEVMRDKDQDMKDRLKASEYQARAKGAFLDRQETTGTIQIQKSPYDELTVEELRKLAGRDDP